MGLAGKGVLAIWNGIAEEAEADFIEWHMREHIPERVAVPGFLRGRRYVAVHGLPKFFNFYETESPEVLSSAAYTERLNSPSDWTKRVVRHFLDTSRTICDVAESLGTGDGAFVATMRLNARISRNNFVEQMRRAVMAPLMEKSTIVAVHLLEGQSGASSGRTAEKALRAQPDQTADWILLVEGADRPLLEEAVAELASPNTLSAAGAIYDEARDRGIYRLQYGLSHSQII